MAVCADPEAIADMLRQCASSLEGYACRLEDLPEDAAVRRVAVDGITDDLTETLGDRLLPQLVHLGTLYEKVRAEEHPPRAKAAKKKTRRRGKS